MTGLPTGPIGSMSRTGMVLDALRTAILSGELRAGQQLVEAELAGRFQISKTPVREAMKTLAGVGLVSMSDYRGASVRDVNERMVRSVLDLRCLLEPEAVRRTVRRGVDVEAAERCLAVSEAATGDEVGRSLANRDFHRVMYADSGNDMLTTVLDGLRDQTALISVTAWSGQPSWVEEAGEHTRILAAAAAGEADAAAELTLAHIRAFEVKALNVLAEEKS